MSLRYPPSLSLFYNLLIIFILLSACVILEKKSCFLAYLKYKILFEPFIRVYFHCSIFTVTSHFHYFSVTSGGLWMLVAALVRGLKFLGHLHFTISSRKHDRRYECSFFVSRRHLYLAFAVFEQTFTFASG